MEAERRSLLGWWCEVCRECERWCCGCEWCGGGDGGSRVRWERVRWAADRVSEWERVNGVCGGVVGWVERRTRCGKSRVKGRKGGVFARARRLLWARGEHL